MTDKEYQTMQEWLSKKLTDTPYYFSAKEKQGWQAAIKVMRSYLHCEKERKKRQLKIQDLFIRLTKCPRYTEQNIII